MRRLGLLLIVAGVLAGPLLTVRAIFAANAGVESGAGEAAINEGIIQAMTASTVGVGVALVGVVLLVVTLYRSRRHV